MRSFSLSSCLIIILLCNCIWLLISRQDSWYQTTETQKILPLVVSKSPDGTRLFVSASENSQVSLIVESEGEVLWGFDNSYWGVFLDDDTLALCSWYKHRNQSVFSPLDKPVDCVIWKRRRPELLRFYFWWETWLVAVVGAILCVSLIFHGYKVARGS